MKIKLTLRALALPALLLSTLIHQPSTSLAQGTAFTYQGRLTDNGGPANGNYDLRVYLRDAVTAGNPVGPTNTIAPVAVSNGLFTVTLDFGAGIFTGPSRWLEIGVRSNGSVAAYSPLSPRQPVTPTPYAQYAASSGTGGGGIWSLNGTNTYYNAGNVGIGTTAPNHRLRLSGGPAWTSFLWQGALELDNGSAIGWRGNGAGNRFGIGQTQGGLTFFATASDPGTTGNPANYLMTINDVGNVGIGTATPTNKLTLLEPGYGFEHTDGTVRLGTYVSFSGGWLGTISNDKLKFFVNGGGASMTVDTNGNVGIGTITPNHRLGITGGPFWTSGFWKGAVDLENGSAIGWQANAAGNRFGIGQTHGGLTFFATASDPGTIGSPANTVMTINDSGNVGIGTATPVARLDVNGTTRTKILTITGGADLAEPFEMSDDNIPKGSVVVIDDEHPGRLMRSERAYDRRVAGIVSGANGVNPGITLQQEGALADGQNVALSGRVYVLADATDAPIKPGDLLTTSGTRGHAMKAADYAQAQGAILGKAMSGLKAGKGMVLVLVTLQ